MDLRQWLHDQLEWADTLLDLRTEGLDDAQWRARACDSNPIAWLVWHSARLHDLCVHAVIRQEVPVLERADWHERLRIDHSLIGWQMTDDEVGTFAQTVDLLALRDYYRVVIAASQTWVQDADLARLSEPIPDPIARAQAAAPVMAPSAVPVFEPWWANRDAAFFLRGPAIGHLFTALGEVEHVAAAFGGGRRFE